MRRSKVLRLARWGQKTLTHESSMLSIRKPHARACCTVDLISLGATCA